MKPKTITIKADVGERIKIPSLELKDAVILALYVSQHCTTYEIGYFHNGERKTAYICDHEFETTK